MNLHRGSARIALAALVATVTAGAVAIPMTLAGASEHIALPESMSGLPQEKKEQELQIREHRANAPRAPKPDEDAARPAPATSVKPWPHGLFQEVEAPISSSVFRGSNRWVGDVGNRTYAVYAGRSGSSAGTGMVLVFNPDSRMRIGASKRIQLAGTGALMIVRRSGDTLVLTDAQGKEHTLDLVARKLR